MSIGISLLLHQDFGRAAELTRALLREGCKIAVHIDAKSPDELIREYIDEFANQSNLIITRRIKCEWGTYSLVRAQLIVAREILDNFSDISHVVQLSGSCLPTRPIKELQKFLEANRGTDFIESVVAGQSNWIKGGLELERFSLFFPFSWRRQRRLFDLSVAMQRKIGVTRKIPQGLEAHIGSQWWALSRDTLLAILNDPARLKNDRYFSKCWIPDESYFQTLVRKHGKRIESRSLTFSRFDRQGNPMLFYDDHIEYLEHLDGFFVRKVWHGAHQLYNDLLAPDFRVNKRDPEMRLAFEAQTERLEGRRNNARPGLSMQSRYLRHHNNQTETAAAYTVLIGFDKIFPSVDSWLSCQIGQDVQGDLFAHGGVELANNAVRSAGNLTTHGKIRDYAPDNFLMNFIWNNRNSLIAFQFWSPKKTKLFKFLTRDKNATIHYLQAAWLLDVMRENITNLSALKSRVSELVEMDRERLELLKAGLANYKTYSLSDVIGKTAPILDGLISDLSPQTRSQPRELPEMMDWQGLEMFAKFLKNNGMNIEFDLSENKQPEWRDQNTKPVLIAK